MEMLDKPSGYDDDVVNKVNELVCAWNQLMEALESAGWTFQNITDEVD